MRNISKKTWSATVILGAFAGVVAGLFLVSHVRARGIIPWPYPKLCKESDLVVIATAIRTQPASPDVKRENPPVSSSEGEFITVVTRFTVRQVLQGEHPEKEFEVVHYWPTRRGRAIRNGPMLVNFLLPEEGTASGVSHGFSPPQAHVFLLFLSRRGDGRYTCVSGQKDPVFSVKVIVDPPHEWMSLAEPAP